MTFSNRLMELHDATNYLNSMEDVSVTVRTMKAILPLAANGVRLTGELAILNILLDLYVASPERFRHAIRLVIRERTNREWPTRELKTLLLGESEEERTRWLKIDADIKKEFTRRYVQNTRERLRDAMHNHNNKLAYNDRIRGKERLEWQAALWKQWTEQKNAYCREGNEGRRMSRAELEVKVAEFWEMIDKKLREGSY